MSVKLQWDGLPSFREALRRAPEHIKAEADAVVLETASSVARDVETAYPEGPTGNLKRGVTSRHERTPFGVSALVRSRARHASIFERGTTQRQTRRGANRGAMPQPPESQRAIPKFVRARQRMTEALIDVVRRAGFEVEP